MEAREIARMAAAGLELCAGGIIGLGETWDDRVDLALALRELKAVSVPLNVLNPIPGKPLENRPRLPGGFLHGERCRPGAGKLTGGKGNEL